MVEDIKIAYICLCHMDADFVAHTAKTLHYKNDGFFIHVDKKVDIKPFLEKCNGLSNAHFVSEENRVKNYWGGFHSIIATMNTIKLAMATDHYDRFVLLQGQDYPLFSNKYIHDFFIKNQNVEFNKAKNISRSKNKKDYIKVSCYWHLDGTNPFWKIIHRLNLTGIKYRSLTFDDGSNSWDIFHSRAYFALTHECVNLILNEYEENSKYNKFMKHRFPPDEIYFASIIHNSEFRDKVSNTIVFNRSGDPTYIDLTYFEYPTVTTVFTDASDYDWLKKMGCLYVRKVNSSSMSLINRIDHEILS